MVVIPSDRRRVGRGFDSHQVHQKYTNLNGKRDSVVVMPDDGCNSQVYF